MSSRNLSRRSRGGWFSGTFSIAIWCCHTLIKEVCWLKPVPRWNQTEMQLFRMCCNTKNQSHIVHSWMGIWHDICLGKCCRRTFESPRNIHCEAFFHLLLIAVPLIELSTIKSHEIHDMLHVLCMCWNQNGMNQGYPSQSRLEHTSVPSTSPHLFAWVDRNLLQALLPGLFSTVRPKSVDVCRNRGQGENYVLLSKLRPPTSRCTSVRITILPEIGQFFLVGFPSLGSRASDKNPVALHTYT